MNSKERVIASLEHEESDKIAIDFGSTAVTGIHVLAIDRLRDYYGLEKKPVKVNEPYQMLGEIEDDLMEAMGIDVIGLYARKNMFGFENKNYKEFTTFWGQKLLVPQMFVTKKTDDGLVIYPEGDDSVPASGKMPLDGFFFDTIVRQEPIEEDKLDPADNLEEFQPISEEDLAYYKQQIESLKTKGKAIIASFGGTALGDIALVPGPFMKRTKGIRDISEWYMSTMMRPDYVHAIFEKQTDIALANLKKIFAVVGNNIDSIFICGTDFGTQDSTFCSPETFDELYMPYYKQINDWIHQNTAWKTFKHSCGAVEGFMSRFIDAGFDIINPVQINAKGMDPVHLKNEYGKHLTFWGGGVDTQKILSFGTPDEVRGQVLSQCETLGKDGGFIFNTVHNVQANTPLQNLIALVEAIKEVNK